MKKIFENKKLLFGLLGALVAIVIIIAVIVLTLGSKRYTILFNTDGGNSLESITAKEKEIVQFLINTDKTFKATYKCYQGIINSLKENDFNKFKSIVLHNNLQISSKMKQALNLYKDNLKYI